MLLPDNLICIDYNVRAHDEILFTPVKSEARCISRKREFNSHISHTFMNASPSSSGASRKTPLAVLTGRRGGRQDNGKRGVYSLGEQLYLGTYQRPLFMSSPQPSSTRPYTGRCVFLFFTFSFSSLSPFSRPSLLRVVLFAHYQTATCFYGRRISMAGPKEDPWNGEVGR